MASKKVRGITIQLGADTSSLEKGLKSVNGESASLNKELGQVNKLIKFDPSNTQLLAQKQKILSESIQNTETKLDALKQAQGEVTKMFKNGDIGEKEYREFERTITETEQSLKSYTTQMNKMQVEQDKMQEGTKQLNTFLEATGKSLEDFQDILGTRLTNALKDGTANSDDLTVAINKIGKAALGADTDIGKMKDALNQVDEGGIDEVRRALQNLESDSGDTEDALNNIGEGITAGNLMEAGEIIAELGEKVIELGENAVQTFQDLEDATNKVTSRFDETGKAADDSGKLIQDIYETGVGDSLDSVANAVILVKDNLKGLNNTDLAKVVSQGLILDETYGVDMTESLRGVNALMQHFGLDSSGAMDLLVTGTQQGLDKTNELGDNLAEYSGKFAEAGYSADEYFQLLNNGLDGGAYNLDKVNDSINEVTTRLADGTIAESIGSYSQNTQDLFAQWQNGEATQKQVIESIVGDINNCTTQQDKLNLAANAFGTMAEDGSMKFVTSLTTTGDAYTDVTGKAEEFQDKTTTSSQETEAAMRKMQDAFAPIGEDIQKALTPILEMIASLAEGFGNLPEPIRNFIEVFAGLAVVATIILAIAAAVNVLNIALAPTLVALGVTIGPFIGIIAAVAAGVAAAVAIIIAVVKNWGAITDWLSEKWSIFVEWITGIWEGITETVSKVWGGIKDFFSDMWDAIAEKVTEIWNSITETISSVWNGIVEFFKTTWDAITETISNVWNGIVEFFKTIWDAIYSAIEVPLKLIKSIIEGYMYMVKAIITTVWEVIKFALQAAWDWIKETANAIFTPIAEFFNTTWNGIKDTIAMVWDAITLALQAAWDWIKDTANAIFTPIAEFFSKTWNGIKDVIAKVWDSITQALSKAWNWVKDTANAIFKPIAEFFSKTWNGIKDTVTEVWDSITQKLSDVWNGIKDTATEVFEEVWGFISDGFTELKETLSDIVKGIANGIIAPIGKAINGVINGVNWILNKVGSDKKFDLWEVPEFEKGSSGLKKDTLGIVNDQKGSNYKELIVPPNGSPFIAQGRNVPLPLKKGTKIMPANQTKSFLDALPHFAGGIGDFFGGMWEGVKSFTGNVWDYATHPTKIIQIAIDKFTDMSSIVEPWISVATGAVSSAFDGIVDFIKGIFDTQSNVNYNPSAGTEQWRQLATRALQMTGQFTEGNLTSLLYQMQTESGGNPNAINNWDINAKRGTPSKGLMQVIDPTFRAYAMPGYNSNVWDPLSNMLASIRYAVSRYGSLSKAYKGVGYADGIGDIDLGSILPMLDVSWFKDGGILTRPGFFKMGNNRIGGAGEDQPEAIAPVQKLKDYIKDAVVEVLGDKSVNITINTTQQIDGRELAKQTIQYTQPLLREREKLQTLIAKGVK